MLFALQPPGALLLYPFRFVDPVTGKWVRARYVAELHKIAAQHARWEIIGSPEVRSTASAMFSPSSKLPPRRVQVAIEEPPVILSAMQVPALDDVERFLVLVFLRRYVTYCTRHRRFAQTNGAARLFAKVRAQLGRPPDK
jgi:hypothetical protein